MINDTITPGATELAPLLAEACASQSETEFVARYLQGLHGLLQRDPKCYRRYGPWWWPLKAALVERFGTELVGERVEVGTTAHYSLDSLPLTICAAWAYQQRQLDDGRPFSASHRLDLPDGELYEYELCDEEMEFRIGAGALAQSLKA